MKKVLASLYGVVVAYRLYHPKRRENRKQPSDFGMAAVEMKVPFAKGKALHAWLIPGDADRVVVLTHGVGMSKSASLAQAKFLHDAGFTVCVVDHRNHGRSDTDRAWWRLSERFTQDVMAVVTHLRERGGYRNAKVVLFGFSFSTFASVYSLTYPGFTVDAIVCDSGPALDIPPLFENLVNSGGVPVPKGVDRAVVARRLAATGTKMLGADWPPRANSRVPMLFITGGADRVIPDLAVYQLTERYARAETHDIAKAGHLAGIKVAPDEYAGSVLDFLERVLGVSIVDSRE